MYKITQLESGQPVIFYLENEKVTMYSINSGRIRNHGIIFTDVESDFDICSDLKLIHYISLSNQAVISSMENLNIREDYIIEGNPQSQATENTNFKFVEFYNCLNIFYCSHNLKDSHFSIRVSRYTTFAKDFTLLKSDKIISGFNVFSYDSLLYLFVFYSSQDFDIYSVNSDYSIVNLLSKQYNSSNPDSSSNLTKHTDKELEKLQAYFNQILDDKNSEIENLKEIQTSITNQYNELADYTGKLQDEVRKLRCNY